MKTKILWAAIIGSCIGVLTSCAFFKPVDEGGMPIEQKEKLVRSGAASATYFAVKEFVDDVEEQNKVAVQLINASNEILKALTAPEEPLTGLIIEKLFEAIPEPYRGVVLALEALQNYYQAPSPNDVLSEEGVRLLKALAIGIKTGATKVLNSNGIEGVVMPVFTAEAILER